MPSGKAFEGFPKELRCGYGPYMAVADTVHDGDTFAVRADVGLDSHPVVWVRLKDVEAPELNEPGGKETRDHLKALIPYETPCKVTTEKAPRSGQEKRTFIRYVAEVELQGGRSLNEEMERFIRVNGYGPGRS